MDTWQEDQLRRMKVSISDKLLWQCIQIYLILKLGGNEPFQTFMRNYTPAEEGGYKEGMDAYDKYHCWAASQYREKVGFLK